MNFNDWCNAEFVSEKDRNSFRDWLNEKGYDVNTLSDNLQWWGLWTRFMKEILGKN